MATEAEVVIVGGGPIGLATAIGLHRRGIEVLVVDRKRPPIDKACGEGLMPDGCRELQQLGVEIADDAAMPLAGIRYIDGVNRAEARFPGLPGLGIRRTTLHQAMAEQAAALGVRSLWGVTVRGLDGSGVLTDQGRLSARWVVGADGLHSRVRQWVELTGRRPRFRRHGVRRHIRLAPWTDMVEVYWSDGCEAYVTPLTAREVGVALLWSGKKSDFDTLLEGFPELQRRLRGAPIASSDRGAGQLEQHSRAVYRDRVVLVGDAAGYRDAITGEGLSVGFHQARALAAAIASDDLEAYARQVRRWTALPFLLIRVLLEAERRPWLRRRLTHALAAEPTLFARLLAIHAREAPPRSLGPTGVLRLARGLLS